MDLTTEYDNRARVPEFAEILDQWKIDADHYRVAVNGELDLAYGDHERQKTDLFGFNKDDKKPLIIFIHGGYWQMLGRETFSHMASGLNAHGFGVLIPSYQLCPAVSIKDIITDMQLLCVWAARKFNRNLVVTGHSAGGHLAAAMLATDWTQYDLPQNVITTGMGISGLYDLRPLIPTPPNDALQLTEETARQTSPLLWPTPVGKRFEAWAGGDESPEFLRQSDTIAACWSGGGALTSSVKVSNKNHFTVINELTDANSNMTRAIINLALFDPLR